MQNRLVTRVSSSLNIFEFEMPDIDIEQYLRYVREMRPTSCLFVDGDVAYPGLFDPEAISKLRKKIRSAYTKQQNRYQLGGVDHN